MRCPICGRPAETSNRPFCSARCKLIDLDNWFEGRYRISKPIATHDEPEDEAAAEAVIADTVR